MLTFHCKTPGTADTCHNKDNSLIEVLFYKFFTGLLAVALSIIAQKIQKFILQLRNKMSHLSRWEVNGCFCQAALGFL